MPVLRVRWPVPCSAFIVLAFAGAASGAPVRWRVEDGGNGHYYEAIFLGENGNTWEFARAAAAARSHAGVQGHLGTITSAAEQSFVTTSVRSGVDMYLGGLQAPDSPAPDQGWSWITGEPWGYTNWDPRLPEPTDGIGLPSAEDNQENYLSMLNTFPFSGNGRWNDVNGTRIPSNVSGYLVEFPVPAPEPSAAALSLVAAWALLRRTRGR